MSELTLEILVSNDGTIHSLSVARGNTHVVVKLINFGVIEQLIDHLAAYSPENASKWIEFGSFGKCPATLCTTRDQIMIIVDGDDCGDNSNQSFGVYFSLSDVPVLLEKLRGEQARIAEAVK
jgi:hypothetical protein